MKKKHILILSGCALLIAAGIAGKLYLDSHIWAGGRFHSRKAQILDLRDAKLTVSEYETLQQELPDCGILWNIPFQGQTYPFDILSLKVTSLTAEDAAVLDYFTELTELDASGCTDYEQLLAFQNRNPGCHVRYQIPLGGVSYESDVTSLELADPSPEELEQMLPFFLQLKTLHLSGDLPEGETLLALQNAFPHIDLQWELSLGKTTLHSTDKILDLSGQPLTAGEAEQLLSRLPSLEQIDLRGCGLTDEEMMALADSHPDCFFLWEMTLGEAKIPTDAQEIDLSGQKLESTEQIESRLSYFPNVKKVVMSHCGFDDETMDALNKRHEDVRFVWSVQIGDVFVRTDATYFYPFTFDPNMVVDSEDIYPLRYCTDMVAIDIGHMTMVDNCEWAAFMPNLKYLVIVETAITDISPLSNLKNLVFLEIFTTEITDYTPLLECTALEDLNLGRTYGDPTPIAQMTWLKNLWWSGIEGTYGLPCSDAPDMLRQALPNTRMKFKLNTPNVDNGWRQLDNYYAMRDVMGVFYLT